MEFKNVLSNGFLVFLLSCGSWQARANNLDLNPCGAALTASTTNRPPFFVEDVSSWSERFLEVAQKLGSQQTPDRDQETLFFSLIEESARKHVGDSEVLTANISFSELSEILRIFQRSHPNEASGIQGAWDYNIQNLGIKPISAKSLTSTEMGQGHSLAIVRLSDGSLLSVHNLRAYDNERLRADVVLLNGGTSSRTGKLVTYAVLEPNFLAAEGSTVRIDVEPTNDALAAAKSHRESAPYVTGILRLTLPAHTGLPLSAAEENLLTRLRTAVGDVVKVKTKGHSLRTIFVLNEIVKEGPAPGLKLSYLEKKPDGYAQWQQVRIPLAQIVSAEPSPLPLMSAERIQFYQGATLRILMRQNDRDSQLFHFRILGLMRSPEGRWTVHFTRTTTTHGPSEDLIVPLALIRGEPN